MALYSSVTGDTFSDIVLITVSAPLAVLALRMDPVEVLGLMMLAFAVIAGLMGRSITKGIIAATLGLLAAMVGTDPEHATPRLFFGQFELYDGLPLPAVAIGMLAIAELLNRLAQARGPVQSAIVIPSTQDPADQRVSWAEYWACRFTIARGAVIGTILGALPGIGSTAAAFMSYASTKQSSPNPGSFGKGNLHGIAATESANSSVMGANMIPLLTLGIPGSVSAALIISAFMIHGVQPGPFLFEQQGRLIYGLFGAMIIANALNFLVGQVGLRLWVRVVTAPESFIFSTALLLCFVGVGRGVRRWGDVGLCHSGLCHECLWFFGGDLYHCLFPGPPVRDFAVADPVFAERRSGQIAELSVWRLPDGAGAGGVRAAGAASGPVRG